MSRGWWIIALALLVVMIIGTHDSLYAQAKVQISRPLDGATVRETVRIIVPASSVPSGGYVAISIDGRRRSALAKDVEADAFVYEWDTKALDPDTKLPLAQRQPREGSHKISVQAFDSAGKRFGDPAEITVNVKNKASELMPASGLLLRFNRKIGAASKYKFSTVTNITDIAGARELADTIGQAIEATEYVIVQSTEDVRPDSTALVRQKLDGSIKIGSGGRMIPIPNLTVKAAYRIEDSCGRTVGSIESRAPGSKVVVEIPNLPIQRVRVGDSWTDVDNVFQDWASGSNMSMTCSNFLEGMEWEGGYPCAKIRTVFNGTKRIPNSPILTEPVSIRGERFTYFAFQVGKVISAETTLTITADMQKSAITSLSERLMSSYTAKFPSLSGSADGRAGSGSGGFGPNLPNEAPPSGGMFRSTEPAGGSGSDSAKVTFEIKQKVELVH